jgi:hypothetical protein
MPIETENPVIIPEKIYSEIWIKNLSFENESPNNTSPIKMNSNLGLAARGEDGIGEWLVNKSSNLAIENLQDEIANDPEIAVLLQSITVKVISMAKIRGII